jgi:hypothetical protein
MADLKKCVELKRGAYDYGQVVQIGQFIRAEYHRGNIIFPVRIFPLGA